MVKGSICGRVGSEGARSNALASWVVVVRYFIILSRLINRRCLHTCRVLLDLDSIDFGFSVKVFSLFAHFRRNAVFSRQHLTPVSSCLLRVWTYVRS